MPLRRPISRRRFLQSTSAALATGPALLSSLAHAAENGSPNERINLGFIGVGVMGQGHLNNFLKSPDVQVIAVCDVVAERRDHAQALVKERYAKPSNGTADCASYGDFRDLLARDDIDAVVIATPDHWHAITAATAAAAKKHIYCEKPLTRTIGEGRKLVNAVRDNGIVFQTGSQQRSEFAGRFRRAVELIRNGHIGEVKTIHIGVGDPAIACDLPSQPVPEGTDWEMWVGPGAYREYNEVLCPKGMHRHFPLWRNYREYAGGGLADMGAHHFDIAQWALDMDRSGPTKIEPPDGDAKRGLRLVYDNGVEMFHGGRNGCTFEGTEGTIMVDRPRLQSEPKEIVEIEIGEDEFHVPPSNNHHRNWLEGIRAGKQPIADVETGHRTSTVCQLANIGYWLRRPLTWDPKTEQFVDDDEANALVSPALRDPWTL